MIIEEILNFEPVHDALDEIKNRLAKCGDLRRDELIREWSDLEARVAHDIDFDAGFVDSWKTTFEKASRVGSLDIRVMEYCVSRFRDYVSGEEGLISPTFDDSTQDKLLETFLAFYCETRQEADGHLTRNGRLERLRQELSEVEPIIWTGSGRSYVRIPALLPVIRSPLPVNPSFH